MGQFVSYLLLSAQFADIGIKFASALHEPVFEVEGFADALVLFEVGGLRENLAVVINAAEHKVAMRMSLVEVPDDDIGSVVQTHSLHIIASNVGHSFVGRFGCVLRVEVE